MRQKCGQVTEIQYIKHTVMKQKKALSALYKEQEKERKAQNESEKDGQFKGNDMLDKKSKYKFKQL